MGFFDRNRDELEAKGYDKSRLFKVMKSAMSKKCLTPDLGARLPAT